VSENSVTLSFGMESDSSLWNVVFPGFDDQALLTARLSSTDPRAVGLMHRFATIVARRSSRCHVAATEDGLLLTKVVRLGDDEAIGRWTAMAKSLHAELEALLVP